MAHGSRLVAHGSSVSSLSLGIFGLKPLARNVSLGIFRFGTFAGTVAWKLALGAFAWHLSLENLRLGAFVWELWLGTFRLGLVLGICLRPSLGSCCLGAFVWELSFANFAWELSLGPFAWEFALGAFAWEHSFGNARLESLALLRKFDLGVFAWELLA